MLSDSIPVGPTYTLPWDPKAVGRFFKALERVYQFSTGTMSLRKFLESADLTRRSVYVRRYARHKRGGCYAELKTPKSEYSVWYMRDGREVGIDVPKIVWDALDDLPARSNEEPVTETRSTGNLVHLNPF